MTRIQRLVQALEQLPEYEVQVLTLYRQRETYTPTPVQRKQAMKQLQADTTTIRRLTASLAGVAPRCARDPDAVWEFSL
jgi:hypothetical protein